MAWPTRYGPDPLDPQIDGPDVPDCPDCETPMEILRHDEADWTCPKCGAQLDVMEVAEQFDQPEPDWDGMPGGADHY